MLYFSKNYITIFMLQVVGALMGAWLSSQAGRKGAVLLSTIPALLGWVIIAIAQNIPMLYVGRYIEVKGQRGGR